MKYLFILISCISVNSFSQFTLSQPIDLLGHKDGARTVHFSADNNTVYGDWDAIVAWDIASKGITKTVEIPGYNTQKSAFNGDDLWLNANSNYNTAKKDIMDMHNNVNIYIGSTITPHQVKKGYGVAAFIPGSTDAIIVGTTETYQFKVVRLNTADFKESTMYFNEKTHGEGVPTAIKISPDNKYVAVSMAGGGAGGNVYSIADGKNVVSIKFSKDANDIAFSGDGKYIYSNDGDNLVQISTETWKKTNSWKVTGTIKSLDANKDGGLIGLALIKKGAILFNATSGSIHSELATSEVADITFSNDSKYLGLGMHKTLHSEQVASIRLYEISY